MAALGIPTTRSLAAVLTGEQVIRENSLPGAVLTRVASSHIRVGTFQYFAGRRDTEALGLLADHVIHRHYPNLSSVDDPYLALLSAVIERQAALVAQWQLIGFIHGVMNTDNMSIAGSSNSARTCLSPSFCVCDNALKYLKVRVKSALFRAMRSSRSLPRASSLASTVDKPSLRPRPAV